METRRVRAAALKKDEDGVEGDMDVLKNELNALYGEVESWTREFTTTEDVLGLQKKVQQRWDRYVRSNDMLIELADPMSLDDVRARHFRQCERHSHYNTIIDSYLTSVAIERKLPAVTDDSASVLSRGSHASRASNTSVVSIRSRARQAENKITQAKLELEFSIAKAKLEASKKIAQAQDQLDESEMQLLLLKEQGLVEDDLVINSMPVAATDFKVESAEGNAIVDGLLGSDGILGKHGEGKPRVGPSVTPLETAAIQEALFAVQKLSIAHDLPTPEIVKFDGKPEEYPRFKSRFEQLVDKKPLDEDQKMARLLQFLTGQARKAVEGLEIAGEGKLKKALDILKRRFGQPYVVAASCIRSITEGTALRSGDHVAFREFADRVRVTHEVLLSMDCMQEINNANLVAIVRRTPVYFQRKWQRQSCKIRDKWDRNPNLKDLVQELEQEASALNDPIFSVVVATGTPASKVASKPIEKPRLTRGSTLATGAQNIEDKSKVSCVICKADHNLMNCNAFKDMVYDNRMATVREHRLCFKCLKKSHQARQCPLKKSCSKDNCSRWHHTLLHREDQLNRAASEAASTSAATEGALPTSEATSCNTGAGTALMQVVPVRVYGKNKYVETYALLDTGSNVTLCDRRLLDGLNIEGEESSMSLTTVSSVGKAIKAKKASLTLSSRSSSKEDAVALDTVWAIECLEVANSSIPSKSELDKWQHLDGIEFPQTKGQRVTVLIGTDYPELLVASDVKKGGTGEPWALETRLGWSLLGPTSAVKQAREFGINAISVEKQLLLQVEKMLAIDTCGATPKPAEGQGMSIEDKLALDVMNKSITKEDGHYEIALPWRDKQATLPNNIEMAKQRLQHLKKRLQRDQVLHNKYTEVIEGYIDKGYAKRVEDAETDVNKNIWYLPHHPVLTESKPGKVRVVFDAAAKFKGTSLNERLLQGPDQTSSLVGVLLRFREGKVAIASDVEAMFHQVKIKPDDSDVLRFLWWPKGDLGKEPTVHKMLVHIFGATSSPSCASFALKQTAKDNEGLFRTTAVQTVRRNFYVDDCLKAVHSEREAVVLATELRELLAMGGFRLTKWMSNSKTVISSVPSSERADPHFDLDLEELPVERALGVQWDVAKDCFGFKALEKDRPATKQGILSVVSSLYDPLGFVSPFTFRAKRLLQDLWRKKKDWDEPIDPSDLVTWQRWINELPLLKEVAVPRNVLPRPVEELAKVELHCVGDASDDGYGAVAYLRTIDVEGHVLCSFLMGKTRLAPLKKLTIPRLELQAAVIAVRMSWMIKQELDIPIDETFYWSDSTTVLQFIKNESKRFQVFVANRVAEIRESTHPTQWHYVETERNPADDVTKGLGGGDFTRDHRWLNGPDFLRGPESEWPAYPTTVKLPTEAECELKTEVNSSDAKEPQMTTLCKLMTRYSSWDRLRVSSAWLLRYKQYLRRAAAKRRGEDPAKFPVESCDIKGSEMQQASIAIFKFVQQHEYADELRALADKDHVSKRSPIRRLKPMVKDGLLRVGGRIAAAPISYDAKHPIILPKKHCVSILLMKYYHEILGHVGQDHTLSVLRQTFWIVHARSYLRRLSHTCLKCLMRSKPKGEQMMSDLPATRLTPYQPAFTHSGVDYFGPLKVKQGRSIVKRYGCIFTCFNCRAIHIEDAHSLETDSFINAFRRFMSRRGCPKTMQSDNGTNFVGAHRELKAAIQAFDGRKINDFMRSRLVNWKFNPPAASHHGGVWERLIQCIRKVLHGVIGDALLTDETLSTWLTEVEAILNNRPLTPLSDDPADDEPLTPNHLLLQVQGPILPPGIFDKADGHGRKRWRQAQYLADQFWKRWLKEYVPLLQKRRKWTEKTANFTAGELVLVVDDTLPRNKWSLGRVEAVFEGRDGCVRTVQVRTRGTMLTRPITKLCSLEEAVH